MEWMLKDEKGGYRTDMEGMLKDEKSEAGRAHVRDNPAVRGDVEKSPPIRRGQGQISPVGLANG